VSGPAPLGSCCSFGPESHTDFICRSSCHPGRSFDPV
jgi:hypothetical protein